MYIYIYNKTMMPCFLSLEAVIILGNIYASLFYFLFFIFIFIFFGDLICFLHLSFSMLVWSSLPVVDDEWTTIQDDYNERSLGPFGNITSSEGKIKNKK